MIKVLKASAGSGKTFRLAKQYILLLLTSDSPEAYRHILAVTFTNKATAEMKQRILKELDILARRPEQSGYHDDLVPKHFPNDSALQAAAGKRLAALLHDYSAFAVSTIDRFFQQTLRAFSREIGHFASYQIDLDRNSLLQESVDRVLDKLSDEDGKDSQSLLNWLIEGIIEDCRQGKKFKLDDQLTTIAKSLHSSDYRDKIEAAGIDEEAAFDRGHLKQLVEECKRIIGSFEKEMKEQSEEVLRLLAEHYGADDSALGRSVRRIAKFDQPPKDGYIAEKSRENFLNALADSNQWIAGTWRRKITDGDLVLEKPMSRILEMLGRPYKVYLSAELILKGLFNLGIAAELRKEYAELQQEKNILNLDDSNTLLRDIIDGSDAPFVYEKTGVRYNHFLLDEFQDTSTVQWGNFLPLLKESQDNHGDNLVVGDVKQCIYRWRGSDWQLLDRGIEKVFHLPDDAVEAMKDNWRTLPLVVDTNNRFFSFAAQQLDLHEQDKEQTFSRLYRDVGQEARRGKPGEGFVEAIFCAEKDSETEEALQAVRRYHDLGWDYGDIAILVRKNDDGALVASRLIEEGIPVISDEALAVNISVTVRRLVSQLERINRPDFGEEGRPSVAAYMAREMGLSEWKESESYHSLADLAEEILRELQARQPELYQAEIPYIQAFMDYLQDRTALDGNDLSVFLEHWSKAELTLATPETGHAVRIMTIHKAKGLEFPCVILPYLHKEELYHTKNPVRWCILPKEDQDLGALAGNAFRVPLTDKSKFNCFEKAYATERQLQIIDNLNVLYVAMTRPKCNLSLISAIPKQNVLDTLSGEGPFDLSDESGLSELLFAFAMQGGMEALSDDTGEVRFLVGTPVPVRKEEEKTDSVRAIPAAYPSYPLNGTPDQTVDAEGEEIPIGQRNRLKFSADAADFFGEDGATGFDASPRVMGTVLHDILSQVVYPETDLEPAVRDAVRSGLLPAAREEEILGILSERITSIRGQHPDWFPAPGSGCHILNETSILDRDGQIWRPDRVIFPAEGKAVIVDYKFGKRNPGPAEADREIRGYLRQIGRYAKMLREMGYPAVEAYLWYPLAGPEEAVITLRPQA